MKAEDQLYALQKLVDEECLTLGFHIARHCVCMGCWVYTFTDIDGTVVLEEDTLESLIEAGAKHYKIEI